MTINKRAIWRIEQALRDAERDVHRTVLQIEQAEVEIAKLRETRDGYADVAAGLKQALEILPKEST